MDGWDDCVAYARNYGALMMVDLDNFKPLNDTHGHHAGDLQLVELARRLMACVREIDTGARVGGDEFVLLIGELDAGQTESTRQAAEAAGIRVSLAAPYRLTMNDGAQAGQVLAHHCTASIGVALFVDQEASKADIPKWADAAMCRAKGVGRNGVQFHANHSNL